MVQNHKIFPVEKAKNPKNIIALLNPYFPDIVSAFQFFELFERHDINLLNQIEHESNFFKLFICQRIKKFIDWGFTCSESIELDFSH